MKKQKPPATAITRGIVRPTFQQDEICFPDKVTDHEAQKDEQAVEPVALAQQESKERPQSIESWLRFIQFFAQLQDSLSQCLITSIVGITLLVLLVAGLVELLYGNFRLLLAIIVVLPFVLARQGKRKM